MALMGFFAFKLLINESSRSQSSGRKDETGGHFFISSYRLIRARQAFKE
jgi:hypothetical protein